MQLPSGERVEHGVILKNVATNICGTDLHMYRGHFPTGQGALHIAHSRRILCVAELERVRAIRL
jgi:threonine dehydrogenase-like Zn-dependent dehydrogenase